MRTRILRPAALWLLVPVAIAEVLRPGSAVVLILGYALLAAIHHFTGVALQPIWFRCVIWIGSAVLLAAVPVTGLAFFPIGALAMELLRNRHRLARSFRTCDDGRLGPAFTATYR